MDEKKLSKSLLQLEFNFAINNSENNLRIINMSIKLYELLIEQLKNNKPARIQKKKFIEYNNKLKEYNNRIEELYCQMSSEMNLIDNLIVSNEYRDTK